jgi:hypothetical protein
MRKTTSLILILLIMALAVSGVIAADIGTKATATVSATKITATATPEPTAAETVENITVTKTGNTTIASALATKSTAAEKTAVLTAAASSALSAVKYPYSVETIDNTTLIEITKYRCTSEMCGYWITATRDGKEIATNSPIWISPPPYEVIVSEVETTSKTVDSVKTVEKTITIKEDPKAAAESVLLMYAGMQPFGKAVVGTKE